MKVLDNLPLASLAFIAGTIITVIAYLNGTVGFDEALKGLGALAGGTGLVGIARSMGGKGVASK